MDNYTICEKLFAIFKRKKLIFKWYFLFNALLSSLNEMKTLYIDLFAFVLISIVGYFYNTNGLVNLLALFVLFYFLTLDVLDKYQTSRMFVFDIYARIQDELYLELRDGKKITTLNNYRQEIEDFLLKFEGMQMRKDTLSYSFRNE